MIYENVFNYWFTLVYNFSMNIDDNLFWDCLVLFVKMCKIRLYLEIDPNDIEDRNKI